ncbi:MAG: hypothetical protein U9Q03_05480 [Patescibacteria group bacterium]|nr:hypothetical protein [Patescibacteria group bacterium]
MLGEPERLARLLNGDVSAVDTSLPEYPAELQEEPPQAPTLAVGVSRTGPLPGWWPFGLWYVLSALFTLSFVIMGYFNYRSANDDPSKHPLLSFPSSALGWMILAAASPGMITAQGIRLFVTDARPALSWTREKFARRTFTDEYERFHAQLENIKTRTAKSGDNELLKRIERVSTQVKQRQNREELGALMRQLDNIGTYLEAQDDLEAFEKSLK